MAAGRSWESHHSRDDGAEKWWTISAGENKSFTVLPDRNNWHTSKLTPANAGANVELLLTSATKTRTEPFAFWRCKWGLKGGCETKGMKRQMLTARWRLVKTGSALQMQSTHPLTSRDTFLFHFPVSLSYCLTALRGAVTTDDITCTATKITRMCDKPFTRLQPLFPTMSRAFFFNVVCNHKWVI